MACRWHRRQRYQARGLTHIVLTRLQTYASFVRLSHSVFALPFALVGALLASRLVPFEPIRLVWIVACMVSVISNSRFKM